MTISRIALAIDSRQIRQAKTDLDTMQRSGVQAESVVAGLGRRLLALGAGVVTVRALVGQFQSLVHEGEQLQRNLLRTDQLILATGRTAETSADRMHDQARQLARATLQSTEEIMQAQQLLMSFRSIGTESFARVTEVAMDLAAVTGTNLQSAMNQLARALENPTIGLSMMRRMGVSFTEAQTDMIKALQESGREMEAQSEILAILEGQYGGVARREAEGLAGAQDALRQAIQEARIEIATYLDINARLTDITKGTAKAVEEFGEKLIAGDFEGKIRAIKSAVELFAIAIASRLIAAVVSAGASMAVATAQSVAYQMALARMAGVSAAAAAGQTVLATAVTAASRAMAFLGGPVGVAILAAGAIYTFRRELGLVPAAAVDTASALDKLSRSLDTLTKAQAAQRIMQIQAPFEAAKKEVETLARLVDTLEWQIKLDPDQGRVENFKRQIIDVRAELDTAKQTVEGYTQTLARLDDITKGIKPAPLGVPAPVIPASPGAPPQISDGMEKQLALLRQHYAIIEAGTGIEQAAEQMARIRLESRLRESTLTEDQIQEYLQLTDALDGATKTGKDHAAVAARIVQLYEQTRTPLERHNELMKELDALLDGGMSWDVYERAAMASLDSLDKGLDKTEDKFASLKRTIEGWGQESASAIADFGMSSKSSFSDMINSMIRDMVRMMVYQRATGPLFAGLGSVFSGGSFSAGLASFKTGRGLATGGTAFPNTMHPVNERGTPELLTVGNRQYLMMGQQGGHVTPMDEKTGGGVVVNIQNAPPGTKTSTRHEGGKEIIDVVIADINGDGPISRTLGRSYGMARRGQ